MASLQSQREEVERSLAAGEFQRALALSGKLLDADPHNLEVLTLRAAALMASDNAVAAVELLEGARSASSVPGVASALAMCQVAAGDLSSAARNFLSALAQRPDDFPLRLAYAECLDMQGDGDAALPEYFRAVNVAQRHGRWLSDASTGPGMRERVKRAMDVIDSGRSVLFERALAPHVNAFGPSSMARVTEALKIYVGAQSAPARDPRQQPKFFWMPGLPAMPFFDSGQFSWYPALEAATPDIRQELQSVLQSNAALTPFLQIDANQADNDYLGGDPQSRSWDAFFFHRHGQRFEDSHSRCVLTSQALTNVPLTQIAEHAPEVLFSVLSPQSHIKPHYGVTNTRVVTHLPLLIPAGDCKLVVGGIEHEWQQGRCVTFDDTFLHEAWNRADQQRVVLILDTWNPFLAPEECIAIKDLIEQIGHFNRSADT